MQIRIATAGLVIHLCAALAVAGDIGYRATVDTSGINAPAFELEFAMYDNSDTVGDSFALLDNVHYGAEAEDFEDGTLGRFAGQADATVTAVPGEIPGGGGGDFMMEMAEDPVLAVVLAYTTFVTEPGTDVLEFDFFFEGSTTPGFFGYDELVVSIRSEAGEPLLPDLTGTGDVLAVNANDGMQHSSVVTITEIPEPASLGLLLAGAGCLLLRRR